MPRIHGGYCGNTINEKYLNYMTVIVKIPLMLHNGKCAEYIVGIVVIPLMPLMGSN